VVNFATAGGSDETLPSQLAALKDRFRPSSPIDKQDLFKGRQSELTRVFAAVQETGQHAVIYGERGVGKTSLAYIVKNLFVGIDDSAPRLGTRFQCSVDDNFASVWQKLIPAIMREVDLMPSQWRSELTDVADRAEDILMESELSPDHVFRALNLLAHHIPLLVIVDELDRVGDLGSTQLFADLIKTLSDNITPCTVLMIGVADDVDGLIQGHQSVERALKQIQMPRMAPGELRAILVEGFEAAGLNVDERVVSSVVRLSQGLPHYTHLLGGLLGELALLEHHSKIDMDLLPKATQRALEEAQRSIQVQYAKAVSSVRRTATFSDTLLACALAEVDDLGYFAPIDVAKPLSIIQGKPRDTSDYIAHLSAFVDNRGFPLETRGAGRNRRYRFRNPLLQPFVVLKGVDAGKISLEAVETDLF
jgi:Cdc6-like AAA superfamily ATPase